MKQAIARGLRMARHPAAAVASGIFASRLVGLLRVRAFSYYFGLQSDAADAFNAAFRIPNLLQNLFGEGALSASFIPVYAMLVAKGKAVEADRVAGAVASVMSLALGLIVLVGVVAAPSMIGLIAPGFAGDKRDLTIQIVRVLFPGAAMFVLSAWCLGVLNSHHRFLLSYAAPVMWNALMIATLVWFGGHTSLPRLAVYLAWGSVAGSALQVAVQLPSVLRVAPDLRFAFDVTSEYVKAVAHNFVPVLISRGVVQVSAYIDVMLASLLPTGAVTGITNAQILYTLPISLFGVSVSAAELPAMSGAIEVEASGTEAVRQRLNAGLRQIAFFVVPSAMAFLVLGDVVSALLLQTGRFTHADAIYVWGILAGSAVGLLASTLGRLYASTYYAMRDTRTPLRYALVRVVLTTVLGYLCAIPLPRLLGIAPEWGAAGLTVSAGISGWVEMLLLRRVLNARIGQTGLSTDYMIKLWTASASAAAMAWAAKLAVAPAHPIAAGVLVLAPYGVVFFGVALLLRIPEAFDVFGRAFRLRAG